MNKNFMDAAKLAESSPLRFARDAVLYVSSKIPDFFEFGVQYRARYLKSDIVPKHEGVNILKSKMPKG